MIGPFIVGKDGKTSPSSISTVIAHARALSALGDRVYVFTGVETHDPDYPEQTGVVYAWLGNTHGEGERLAENTQYENVTLIGRGDSGDWMNQREVIGHRVMCAAVCVDIAQKLRDRA